MMRIGTRGSQLALWQARTVARLIAEAGGPACELVVIRTSGDESAGPPDAPRTPAPYVARTSRSAMKDTFVKEIEDALLEGRIDLAVHSSKDLSAVLPDGLAIGAALAREDPRDAILLPRGEAAGSLDAVRARLGAHPRIGTSSVRRTAQLAALVPGATFAPIRGNVDTRLRKLDAGECDALVLACAGLERLGRADRISFALPVDMCVPAPGQGIVAVEIRDERGDVARAVGAINDRAALDALTAERAVVRALGGGCQMPLGAYAQVADDNLAITAVVISPDGSRVIRDETRCRRADARRSGEALAQSLLKKGAADILQS